MFDVTLTFDNGPEPEVTPAVLGTLARESNRATFFVLGHKIADPRRRALAERTVSEGHWIGNHTYSHTKPLGELTDAAAPDAEIGRTQSLIGELSHPDKLFRPFGGGGVIGRHLLSRAALHYLEAGGYSCVLWNVIPRDFDDARTWPERALDLMRPLPWALVVLHDLPVEIATMEFDKTFKRLSRDGSSCSARGRAASWTTSRSTCRDRAPSR